MNKLEIFYSRIDSARKEIHASNKSCWFRGQSAGWPLNTSMERYLAEQANRLTELDRAVVDGLPLEESMFCDFLHRNGTYSLNSNSSWEILAAMQHFQVPTRLLDWSESLTIAIFFALVHAYDPKSEKIIDGLQPTIYLLNPYKLSANAKQDKNSKLAEKYLNDRIKIWNTTISRDLDYLQNVIINKEWHFSSPIPIYATWSNPRIAVQQGAFTFQGTDPRSLCAQNVSKDCLRKVYIKDNDLAKALWRHMMQHNITKYHVYRDLDSLAGEIREKYKPMPNIMSSKND
jgi:hypothetical protein